MTSARDRDPADAAPTAVTSCIVACQRCAAVAAAVGDTAYARCDGERASIGAHVRHALEHVECLLDGLHAGDIDYDARRRDPRIEADPAAAREASARLEARLHALDAQSLAAELTVREAVAEDGTQATVTSSVGRELTFVASHAIHHVEIATLVARLRGIELPARWGLAFSTAAHRAG